MTIGDILIGLCVLFCLFVGIVARRAQLKRAMLESQARNAVLEQPSSGLRARATAHSPAARELSPLSALG